MLNNGTRTWWKMFFWVRLLTPWTATSSRVQWKKCGKSCQNISWRISINPILFAERGGEGGDGGGPHVTHSDSAVAWKSYSPGNKVRRSKLDLSRLPKLWMVENIADVSLLKNLNICKCRKEKKVLCFAKQQPGRARWKSLATTYKLFSRLCIQKSSSVRSFGMWGQFFGWFK